MRLTRAAAVLVDEHEYSQSFILALLRALRNTLTRLAARRELCREILDSRSSTCCRTVESNVNPTMCSRIPVESNQGICFALSSEFRWRAGNKPAAGRRASGHRRRRRIARWQTDFHVIAAGAASVTAVFYS